MSGPVLLELLAKARIEEAIAKGMLDNLPGADRPLVIADDRLVPEGLRGAYRVLVAAGRVPPDQGPGYISGTGWLLLNST